MRSAENLPSRRLVNKEPNDVHILRSDYQDGTVSVSNRRIGDTADQSPANPAEPPVAHHY
jgi:hypothetical protein